MAIDVAQHPDRVTVRDPWLNVLGALWFFSLALVVLVAAFLAPPAGAILCGAIFAAAVWFGVRMLLNRLLITPSGVVVRGLRRHEVPWSEFAGFGFVDDDGFVSTIVIAVERTDGRPVKATFLRRFGTIDDPIPSYLWEVRDLLSAEAERLRRGCI
jgi:hypothetical protein